MNGEYIRIRPKYTPRGASGALTRFKRRSPRQRQTDGFGEDCSRSRLAIYSANPPHFEKDEGMIVWMVTGVHGDQKHPKCLQWVWVYSRTGCLGDATAVAVLSTSTDHRYLIGTSLMHNGQKIRQDGSVKSQISSISFKNAHQSYQRDIHAIWRRISQCPKFNEQTVFYRQSDNVRFSGVEG